MASAWAGPSANRSAMSDWNSANAAEVVNGFSSPSITATWTKLTPSSRRKVA